MICSSATFLRELNNVETPSDFLFSLFCPSSCFPFPVNGGKGVTRPRFGIELYRRFLPLNFTDFVPESPVVVFGVSFVDTEGW